MKYLNFMQYARAITLILFGLFLLGMYVWPSLTYAPSAPHRYSGAFQQPWLLVLGFCSIGFGVLAIAYVRWRTRRAQLKAKGN